ncbi:glycoside hydrolase family 3 N-terminal domain-containing protein [Paracoccus sp. p3-h83]|uniref:glycoside hydrolase family 3 N-terminal domain-containing protein n=1 Tax=Paracoccus sp. p3-h83 TaxID=3342805 RepID=UPI0035BA2EFE
MAGAAILGLQALRPTRDEARLFADADPFGFILFARNIDTPDQVRALCADLRDAVGRDAPILIDQEGGRVQRLRAPQWREWLPPLAQVESCADPQAMWLRYRLIAAELRDLGIDTNCAPTLDLAGPDTHPFLRNRCFGSDPATVIAQGRACAEGLLAGGVLPVMKHMPGHGRAVTDSHMSLPTVTANLDALTDADFAPFAALADLPMGMTAHIRFAAIDDAPATQSPTLIGLIRDRIGFDGLLMSDDLSMEALSGTVGQRAAASVAAGCDVALYGKGEFADSVAVANAAGSLSGDALRRADQALAARMDPEPVDLADLAAQFADRMQPGA